MSLFNQTTTPVKVEIQKQHYQMVGNDQQTWKETSLIMEFTISAIACSP